MTIKASVIKAVSMMRGEFTADAVVDSIKDSGYDKPVNRDSVVKALRELTYVSRIGKMYRAKGRAV